MWNEEPFGIICILNVVLQPICCCVLRIVACTPIRRRRKLIKPEIIRHRHPHRHWHTRYHSLSTPLSRHLHNPLIPKMSGIYRILPQTQIQIHSTLHTRFICAFTSRNGKHFLFFSLVTIPRIHKKCDIKNENEEEKIGVRNRNAFIMIKQIFNVPAVQFSRPWIP